MNLPPSGNVALGTACELTPGYFARIQIPNHCLILDFDNRDGFLPAHGAINVTETQYEDIYGHVVDVRLTYGTDPWVRDYTAEHLAQTEKSAKRAQWSILDD